MTREQAFARAWLHVAQEQGTILSRDPCNMVSLGASLRLVDVAWPIFLTTFEKRMEETFGRGANG